VSPCVVDASVTVKWFVAEQHSDLALAVLRNEDLIAPDLLWPEIGNIIWKKVQRHELAEADARSILDLFLKAPITSYSSAAMITAALDVAIETGRTVYDSLYVTLAALEGCRMITADRRLFNSLAGTAYAGLSVWLGDVDPTI
jgi:predicted nucleic acid-binding protein